MKPVEPLFQDGHPINQPKDSPRYLLNTLRSKDRNAVVIEEGIELFTTLPTGSIIIGTITVFDGVVVFYKLSSSSRIVKIDRKGVVTTVLVANGLSFNENYPIRGDFWVDNTNQTQVYWTDNLNPPRYINITTPPTITDVNQLSIFPKVLLSPRFTNIVMRESGGNLPAGAVQFFLSYIDKQGNNETSAVALSNWVTIVADNQGSPDTSFGAVPGTITSKSIEVYLANLDLLFSKFRIYAVHKENGVIKTPKHIGDYDITGSSGQFTYTGTETFTEKTLEELVAGKAHYDKAKVLKIHDNRMYLANLQSRVDIGVQRYVNNIKVTGSYSATKLNMLTAEGRNPQITFNLTPFEHDEVYALYIAFTLTNGKESFAYHIPGRRAVALSGMGTGVTETSTIDQWKVAPGSNYAGQGGADLEDVFGPTGKMFHAFDTRRLILDSSIDNNLSYWENATESYPNTDDWDVWGVDGNDEGVNLTLSDPSTYPSLRGQPVRHHKTRSISGGGYIETSSGVQTGSALVLGFTLSDIKLPNRVWEQVTGYKVYYAKRDFSNCRVVTSGTYHHAITTYRHPITNTITNNVYHYTANAYGGPYGTTSLNASILRFNSFDLHALTPPTSIMQYCKVNMLIRDLSGWLSYGSGTLGKFHADGRQMNDRTNPTIQACKKITGAVYQPQETSITLPPAFGVATADNFYGESCLLLKTISDMVIYGYAQATGSNWASWTGEVNIPVMNIYCDRRDMYKTFNNQTLIFTGYQSNSAAGSQVTSSLEVYGGDVFIDWHNYKSTAAISSDPTVVTLRTLYSYMVQTKANIGTRWEGEGNEGKFFPKSTSGDTDAYLSLDVVGDYIGYSSDYNTKNDLFSAIPKPKDFEESGNYFSRIHRSLVTTSESAEDKLLQFLVNDYTDLTKNRGQIVNFGKIGDTLLPHFEKAIMKTYGNPQITSDIGDIAVTTGDVFSINPRELIYTDYGYGGTQSSLGAITTPFGYFYPDRENGKVFILGGEALKEISAEGMQLFFQEYLPSKLLKQVNAAQGTFTNIDAPSSSTGIGITSAYDFEYRRIIMTVLDYEIKPDLYVGEYTTVGALVNGKLYTKDNAFYRALYIDPEGPTPDPGSDWVLVDPDWYIIPVPFSNTNYFTPKHWTISYYPEMQGWGSFHSYYPYHYITMDTGLYSISSIDLRNTGTRLYKHNSKTASPTLFYNATCDPMIIEYVDNEAQIITKQVQSLSFITRVELDGVEYYNETFNTALVYNSNQSTGAVTLTQSGHFPNSRKVSNQWNFNGIRDAVSNKGVAMFSGETYIGLKDINTANINTAQQWWKKSYLVDKHHVVRLTYQNNANKLLSLHEVALNVIPYER